MTKRFLTNLAMTLALILCACVPVAYGQVETWPNGGGGGGGGVVPCIGGTPPGTVCIGANPQLVWTYRVSTPIGNRTSDINITGTGAGGDCMLYWGDGTASLEASCNPGPVSHAYTSDGPWTISLVGPLSAMSSIVSLSLGDGVYSGALTFDPLLPFPALTAFTYQNAASTSLPLTSPFAFNPNLTTITVRSNPALASIPVGWLNPLIGMTTLALQNNPLLSTFSPGLLNSNTVLAFGILTGNALNVNSVNTLLFELASTVGTRAICTLDLSGGTSAAPTIGPPDGIASAAALVLAGWSVTTN